MTLGDPGIWRATPLSLACHLTRYEPEGVRYPWVRHADFISQRIAMAVDGIAPRFICLSEPPQHMKSNLVSKWANVWFLENWPHLRCILGGYSSDFAEVWGRRTRDAIDLYSGELSVRLNPLTNAAGEWETTAGGGLVATGVGGSITGRSGEGLIVIDDPYKDRAAANSAQVRENVWQWFTEVMLTRRAKNTVFIVIHTRWSPDDLIGRIQKKQAEGDPDFPVWDFINLPAIAEADDPLGREPGEALWPESKPIEFLRQQRAMMGSWSFNALYQGNPTDIEGNYFKRAWLESPATQVDPQYVPPRHLMRLVRIWDLAATTEGTTGGGTGADGKKRKRTDPDWSVGLLAGWYQGLTYVLDVERFRLSPAKTEQRVLATARRDGPLVKVRMQQDPGQAGVAQVHHYARNVLRAYDFRWKPAAGSGDKVVRSGPVNAAYERGDVKVVKGPWVEDYVEELCLAKGTRITTMRGDVPIEDVTTDDLVPTRSGWRRVARSQMTSESATLCEIRTDDGCVLRATPNHPILVSTYGFTPAGRLRVGDALLRFTGGSNFDSTQTQRSDTSPADCPTDATSSCSGSSGRTRSDRSPKGSTSTTGITTRRTTGSITSSACRPPTTCGCTGSPSESQPSVGGCASSAESGTAPRRPGVPSPAPSPAGTNTNSERGQSTSIAGIATSAEGSTGRRTIAAVSVPESAAALTAEERENCQPESANGAGRISSQELPPACFAASPAVISVHTLPGRHAVYNLEVEGCHEYVAEGIVVHNCMFPLGAHDDQVDVTSYAYDELANAVQEDWNQENLAKAFSYGAAGQQGGQPDPDADPMAYLRWRQQQAAAGRPAGDDGSDN